MTDQARARRLADRIREITASTVERQVKDPRLGFVTITEARVTADLREATVYYTVYGDDTERAASAAALESAKGLVRTRVGRETGIRYTPSIAFVADVVPATARHLDELIQKVKAADAELQRAAEGAEPAGEADPYRRPVPDDSADAPGELVAGGGSGAYGLPSAAERADGAGR